MDTLHLAKQHQQQERDRVTRATGLQFSGDDVVAPVRHGRGWVVVPCPRCAHVSVGETVGRAVKSITAHLVKQHGARKEQ